MLRTILGVVVGYLAMFAMQVGAFMKIYSTVGPEWAFEPASFAASTRWTLMQFAVILITAAIAGTITVCIVRKARASLALAGVILLLGLALGAVAISMKKNEPVEVRTGNVTNLEAMKRARHPAWVIFLGPLIGAAGAVVGGKVKRSS